MSQHMPSEIITIDSSSERDDEEHPRQNAFMQLKILSHRLDRTTDHNEDLYCLLRHNLQDMITELGEKDYKSPDGTVFDPRRLRELLLYADELYDTQENYTACSDGVHDLAYRFKQPLKGLLINDGSFDDTSDQVSSDSSDYSTSSNDSIFDSDSDLDLQLIGGIDGVDGSNLDGNIDDPAIAGDILDVIDVDADVDEPDHDGVIELIHDVQH